MNEFKMKKISIGSICSGIEAASVAIDKLNFEIKWFSEIADFPSQVLAEKYPNIDNLGDMRAIPEELLKENIQPVDFICGGTPCQAFSLAGLKKGLNDDRGNLTIKFIDIIHNNDLIRKNRDLPKSIVLWENVEGVLRDKTNAFGCFISTLLGLSEVIDLKKWPLAGAIHGMERNIAWRVLDAKYFGLPQQRRRLYLLSGGKDFFPENVLFDKYPKNNILYKNKNVEFKKNGYSIEVFRDYTDCLYSAYGTKWNGNAAAYNGSLFVSQNEKLRRLTPLECERLMGFPDNYTDLPKSKPTTRYQAIGNSWAVPVIKHIAVKLEKEINDCNGSVFGLNNYALKNTIEENNEYTFYRIPVGTGDEFSLFGSDFLNGSVVPENPIFGDIKNIIETDVDSKYYISAVGCHGILRRSKERGMKINPRLEKVLSIVSSTMDPIDIERKSRVQKRGIFSD